MRSKYSRLDRHNKKQANKQAIMYVLMSLVFIGVMIKWGLPGMIGFVSWMSNDGEIQATSEHLKPQKPVLSPLPEATFSARIKVAGIAQPEKNVKLRLNGLDEDELTTDSNGEFQFNSVELNAGENDIEVRAYDEDGVESDPATTKIIQDSERPKLTISSPQEEHKFFGMDQKRLELVGEISEEAEVTINDNFVRLDDDYKFVFQTQMIEGANDYTIKIIDRAGNKVERLFRVFYTQ